MRYKAYGEDNHNTTLTAQDVRSIREIKTLGYTLRQIADFYSISPSSVAHIVHRRTWKHV